MFYVWLACQAPKSSTVDSSVDSTDNFHAVFISDSHVIGPQYECCSESEGIDNLSIVQTPDRLRQVVEQVLQMDPQPEALFLSGDVVHDAYFSDDFEDYTQTETAFSVAKDILSPLQIPIYPAMGNHDYHFRCDGSGHSKELSHDLFEHYFGVAPYYAITHKGWKFLILNSQLGSSWDANDPNCDTGIGSYGEAQLRWLDEELSEGVPSLVLSHHMLSITRKNELEDTEIADVETILSRHSSVVRGFFVGHTHRWIDFGEAYAFPHVVLGATRYDSDNFWLYQFETLVDEYEIVDIEKAKWYTTCADEWVYSGMLDYDAIMDGLPYPNVDAEEQGDCE
jgi:hypothetical protein